MEEPLKLLEEAKRLAKLASETPHPETALILLSAAAEAAIAAILLTSSARRSKRLCTSSTRRLLNMALVELQRLRLIDAEKAAALRHALHALRCTRNRLLHPWLPECTGDKCRETTPPEARDAVNTLIRHAERLLEIRGYKTATPKTPE